MGAIAGVCHWDQQPVSSSVLSELAVHCRPFGADGTVTTQPRPWLALQVSRLHFDRLAKSEHQPFVFGRGCVLTWDGRLDNRDDLLLRLFRDVNDDHSDAALVAAAYSRWGLDCLPELIVDWSLAIWDATAGRVVLARDYAGNRRLYYLQRGRTLAWARSLDGLIEAFGWTEPDDEWVAGSLMCVPRPDLTPLAGVRMLRGAHMLVANANDMRIQRYWTFSPKPIVYRHSQDYIDH